MGALASVNDYGIREQPRRLNGLNHIVLGE